MRTVSENIFGEKLKMKNGILSIILLNSDPKSLEISHQALIGTLICQDGHVGRCIGYKINPPEVHECCLNSEFWELKVEMSGIEIWGPLLRTGGDSIKLSLNSQDSLMESLSDRILNSFEFTTSKVMIDDEAKQFISKYYPDLSFESDMIACVGMASWEYNL